MTRLCIFVLGACGRVAFDPSARDADIADGVQVPACDTSNLDLVGCWAFDGDVLDSGMSNLPTQGANVAFVEGRRGLALQHIASTQVIIAEHDALDLPATITIAGWVRLDTLPEPGARAVLVDNETQYSVSFDENGLSCLLRNTFRFELVPPIGTWMHVACVYDGTAAIAYRDGVVLGAMPADMTLSAVGSFGTYIGSNHIDGAHVDPDPVIGAIDELQVWRIGVPASVICTWAGTC